MKPRQALWRFALASAVAIVLLILISNVIEQPVAEKTRTYNAEFTDVSGLHEGADVRVRGVRAGKVEAVALKREGARSVASVRFTLEDKFSIVPTSRVAVKFQALTGLRYMDVANAATGDGGANRVVDVPTSMTVPSFDVTQLFNGLQPVLATLSPDQINTFTDNAAAFLAGDGEGLAPMVDSIHKLAELTSNRQQTIATIVQNLSTLANQVHGRSSELIETLQQIQQPVDAAMTVLDEFRKSNMYGPAFIAQVLRLLDGLGLKPGIDPDRAFDRAFTNVYDVIDGFKRVPVLWENIAPPASHGQPLACSHGRAELPLPMDVLLNGRKVVLCNQ